MADLICERSRKNYISVREDRESEAHPKEVVLDRGGKKEKGKSKEGERQQVAEEQGQAENLGHAKLPIRGRANKHSGTNISFKLLHFTSVSELCCSLIIQYFSNCHVSVECWEPLKERESFTLLWGSYEI